jgi:hypothetical protein
MRPAGQAEVDKAKADGRWDAAYDGPSTAVVPEDLAAALAARDLTEVYASLDSRNRFAILHLPDRGAPGDAHPPHRAAHRRSRPGQDPLPPAAEQVRHLVRGLLLRGQTLVRMSEPAVCQTNGFRSAPPSPVAGGDGPDQGGPSWVGLLFAHLEASVGGGASPPPGGRPAIARTREMRGTIAPCRAWETLMRPGRPGGRTSWMLRLPNVLPWSWPARRRAGLRRRAVSSGTAVRPCCTWQATSSGTPDS